MSGLFSVTVEEERGSVAVNAELDQLAIVVGCTEDGDGLSSFYLSAASAVDAIGYGDTSDCVGQVIEQRQSGGAAVRKIPAAVYGLPIDTAGSYGTIDLTGTTGTGRPAVDTTVDPLGTYEVKIEVIVGGTIETTGIKYRRSHDGGRNWSNAFALGTATAITMPEGGGAFTLDPPSAQVTALITLAVEMRTDTLGHLADVTAHDAADTSAEQVALAASSVPATAAAAIAVINLCRAAYEAHRVNAPTVHNSADSTNVISHAAATTASSAVGLATEYKVDWAAHLANAVAHNSADVTNTIAAATPTQGTLVAGDSWTVRTFAPTPSTADVDTAFDEIAASTVDFGVIVLEFPCDLTMLAHVTTGLNTLASMGKEVTAIVRSRIPDFETSESEATWAGLVEAIYADYDDSRIIVRSSYGLVTDARTTRQYLRSDLAQFAADVARVGRFVWPCAPADRAMPNFSLVDEDGATVGHDEGPRGAVTGLSNETLGNRLSSVMRLPDVARREDVFNTVPWVLYAADERVRNVMTRRLVNAMKRVAKSAGTPGLGQRLFYRATSPTTGTLTAASRNAVQGSIFQAVSGEFKDEIDNAADAALDTGLVQVSPSVTISGGNLLGLSITIAPVIGGFTLTESFVLSIQE